MRLRAWMSMEGLLFVVIRLVIQAMLGMMQLLMMLAVLVGRILAAILPPLLRAIGAAAALLLGICFQGAAVPLAALRSSLRRDAEWPTRHESGFWTHQLPAALHAGSHSGHRRAMMSETRSAAHAPPSRHIVSHVSRHRHHPGGAEEAAGSKAAQHRLARRGAA
ncbi:hypothetical protein QU42_01555 [Bradyrhizobium sp. UASWS1016]|jgi:hypothetical protein|nr:hypothetical protein QU41_03030 [Bradyrhizobium elkanii]OCX32886.1 hypothetical protein QU42_01555 [Bradyrhizobium sp. UASWS1016]